MAPQIDLSRQTLSDLTVFTKYANYLTQEHRRETWGELVTRNKDMHIRKFPQLKGDIESAYEYVYAKKVLPSMRGLQFGGRPVELNPARQYNCSFMHMNSLDTFKELMFLLLAGCGVGYSVQQHHVADLPIIIKPKKSRRFLVADSIEGWADAVGALMSAYMGERKSLPSFDFSDIRPLGARLKTSGGIAPGPEPLKTCLHHVQTILDRKSDGEQLAPLEVHDINCHLADAVRSGGIRRSAMIALFSFRDEGMRTSKFGKWYESNPQRALANNSAVILRHKITQDEFTAYFEVMQNSKAGEPGIFFTNDQEIGTNPCGEISLKSHQFCNLVTVNVSDIESQGELNRRAECAAFIATLQASYTSFHYLREIWQETTEKDALIGVSLTGIASGKVAELNLEEAVEEVKAMNVLIAKKIGINPASRCTTVKPEGTSSLVLGCSSGIHAWHSDYYLRRNRVGKAEAIYKFLAEHHPYLVEDDFFKPQTEAIITLPIKAPDGATTRTETALQFLTRVELMFRKWVKPGFVKGHNHNNISCTVSVKPHEWERVQKWMWENRERYTAITVLPYDEHTYVQAPFEEITKEQYATMIKSLKPIDFTKVTEREDNTTIQESVACGGGACEIV